MSFQDTLMNIVYINDLDDDNINVKCSWCDFSEFTLGLFSANNIKIDHENDHGIYLDPDTGEMYYDLSEDCRNVDKEPLEPWPIPLVFEDS